MKVKCNNCGLVYESSETIYGMPVKCVECKAFFTAFPIPAQSVPAQGMSKEELSELSTPSHYNIAIQPVDYIAANNMDFFHGNVIKYVTRWQGKDGIKDLEKAMDYLQRITAMAKAGHYGEKHKSNN